MSSGNFVAPKKSGSSAKRNAVALVVVVVVGFLAWRLFGGPSAPVPPPQARAVPVSVAAAQLKDMPVYFNGLGTVQASNTVTIRSRVDGQLTEVDFKEGQDVKKGDLLARIDPRIYQAQYDQAVATKQKDEALLANARIDLTRYINLGNRVTGQQVDTQRALVQQLVATVAADQASIDNAKTMLSYTQIDSPIDGRTGIRLVDPGNIVHAADANGLVVITQLQPISVLFTLPQQNLPQINLRVAEGTPLKVVAIGADNVTQLDEGTLSLVDNQIDPNTGTMRLKATFPNAKQTLWPGGLVSIRLLVKTRKDSVVVPSVAVQNGPQGPYVFVAKPDNTAEIRPIKVALTENQDTLVDQGINPGERVVTDGVAKLQSGTPISFPNSADASDARGSSPKTQP
jgi:multidrug efflux system membrane fusion protein